MKNNLFPLKRVFIAFFIPVHLWLVILIVLEFFFPLGILKGHPLPAFFMQYMLAFIPSLLYAFGIEFLQKYIKGYLTMGLSGIILSVSITLLLILLSIGFVPKSSSPITQSPISISEKVGDYNALIVVAVLLLIAFFVAMYMKFLYNKDKESSKKIFDKLMKINLSKEKKEEISTYLNQNKINILEDKSLEEIAKIYQTEFKKILSERGIEDKEIYLKRVMFFLVDNSVNQSYRIEIEIENNKKVFLGVYNE